MANKSLKWLALLGGVTLGSATLAVAQDSGALLDALVRKGVLNDQEAEDIRADLTRDFASSNIFATPGGKSVKSLAISGRVQTQFISFDNDNAAASTGFLLRRVYLGAKASLAPDWTADVTYNFADSGFDKAIAQWKGDLFEQAATVDVGLRKVNFGYEETTSSASLKAIERSPATRFFIEADGAGGNGELGAGAHRIGVFLNLNDSARSGKEQGLYGGLAVTNPERQTTGVGSARSATLNSQAFWADAGYSFKTDALKGKVGAAASRISEGAAILSANNRATLTGYSVYGDVTFAGINLAAEFLTADIKDNTAGGLSANPYGFWIQPSYKINEKIEVVARYSYIKGDGRDVDANDLIRRSGTGFSGTELDETYIGGTYFIKGNDLKLQLGYLFGEVENATGVSRKTQGIRSQLQILF
jgi:hypothetical protein